MNNFVKKLLTNMASAAVYKLHAFIKVSKFYKNFLPFFTWSFMHFM